MEDDQDLDICSTTLPLSVKFMEVTLLRLDHESAIHLHRALLGHAFLEPCSHAVRKPKQLQGEVHVEEERDGGSFRQVVLNLR